MYSRSGFGDLPPAISFQKTSGTGDVNLFRVGESWSIRVTGPANQPVWFLGGQQGNTGPTAQIGTTDSSGVWSMSGTMTEAQIGAWNETWVVGGVNIGGSIQGGMQLGTLNFQVVAAATPTTPPPSTQPTTAPPSSGYLPPSTINELTGASGINVAGYNIPWWGLAAAAGALFFLSGRHR